VAGDSRGRNDNGFRLDRSVDGLLPSEDDSGDSTPASKTARRVMDKKAKSASSAFGNSQSAIRSTTWYDDNAQARAETSVDRLVDSGLGTLKKCALDGSSKTTTAVVSDSPAVQNQPAEPPVRVTAASVKAAETEGNVKQKKPKNEDSRNSRRVAVGRDTAERRAKEGGDVGERSKSSTKATASNRTSSQNRRTEQRPKSTPVQPHRRELPKIVINRKAEENEDVGAGVDNGQQATGSRPGVHANTDPNIATVALDVRSKVATAFADTEGHSLIFIS